MDTTRPYMRIERGKTGKTAAIRLVMPDGSSVDVAITRNEKNAAAFDYFSDKLQNGVNL
jgi:hypothetical protein